MYLPNGGSFRTTASSNITTDESWRCSAQYEVGWSSPSFSDSHWSMAAVVEPYDEVGMYLAIFNTRSMDF